MPEYIVKNPIPLSHLNLSSLDTETRLILEEKEQALLASQETVQIHQVSIVSCLIICSFGIYTYCYHSEIGAFVQVIFMSDGNTVA